MSSNAAAAAEETADASTPTGGTVVLLSDRVLLERHVRGDRAAFPELVRTYGPQIHGYLARCGIPAADRDDVFQDVFYKVHRALGRGLPDGPVKPWLFAIAVNTARDSFRRAGVRKVVALDNAATDTARDDEPATPPDRTAEAREIAGFLEREVDKLTLDQREVLVLCCVQGMSLEEAATAVGAPVNTVKTRLRRARLTLAEAMHRRGLRAAREESR